MYPGRARSEEGRRVHHTAAPKIGCGDDFVWLTTTRLAHRIRDMQTLPYCVVANPRFNEVYELYYEAFDRFRRVPEVRTLGDNDAFCVDISNMLKRHLSVIPKLAMGILETSADEMLPAKELDGFMNAILRSV